MKIDRQLYYGASGAHILECTYIYAIPSVSTAETCALRSIDPQSMT